MRILQICAAYKPAFVYGGPTRSVSALSEQLVKAGIGVEVFTTTANGSSELPVKNGKKVKVDGVPVTYFKRVTGDHTHFSPALLKQLWVDAQKFDVIHIHAWWNLVSVLSCFICLLKRVPVIVSPRGTLSPYSFRNKNSGIKALIHHLVSKPLLKSCFLHVTSQRENDAVKILIHPRIMVTLPNFIELPAPAMPTFKERTSCFKLLFLSRIEEKKGLELLIGALALLPVTCKLTIAGSGDEAYVKHLKAFAIDRNVAGKIEWIGFQNRHKFEVLQNHDLFVLPSYDENFGNAVIESLSVGTPVLISEEVGLAAYVNSKRLGWICQTSESSVASVINLIINERVKEVEEIRRIAPGIIFTDFEEGNLVKKYMEMYQQSIKK
ncbi:glycosyltransferase [Mucilaginibacter sp. BJC16-A38]|uniref:XrtY-associated glycosyltransferase XYAG1 n=1 Tax=Mucilaginibacter phenanthrenivorans TaxID=1234842 RepID=UPI002158653A|nr:glycosyltransferase [Mucilaginibacter phenanthrenivorans]MCR8560170.1 glycosyltransferase [Mucilaginibacter phenanthrenivorans]